MKRRKLKISIIPHGSENIKVTRFFIIALPIIALVIIIVSISLTAVTVMNLRNLKDYSSIKKLREDVAILTIKTRESKRTVEEIEKGIDELKNKTQSLMPVYSYMSGIKRTEEDIVDMPQSTDSVLMLSNYVLFSYDSILSTISNESYAAKVPSLIPVNGWVLRDYGNVTDPYTETERFHPGILLVADEGEPVYAAADGYVIFAGQKDKLGNTVMIKHTQQFTTTYAHLSGIEISSGKTVKKGEIIGYTGKTGKVLSSALYYEIKRGDNTIDPMTSFLIPVYDLYDSLTIRL